MASGGNHPPSHPAPVSGPGALSARTDGGPTTQPPMVADGGPYGSRKDQLDIQQGAALQGGGDPTANLIPLDAPTQNPGEPVTAGAAAGPGIGPQAAGIQSDQQGTNDALRPMLRSLGVVADLPGSTPEMRSFYRNLVARLSG